MCAAPISFNRIEDYALIGDCESAALVGKNGSIDWLCWPRFDSDACFAALLGTTDNGRWLIAPKGKIEQTQRVYRGNTLILETSFVTSNGRVKLIDFMPVGNGVELIRLVVGEEGSVEMQMELILRFGFGAFIPWVTHAADGVLKAIAGPDMIILECDVGLRGEDMTTRSDFSVKAGETLAFVMSYGPSHLPAPKIAEPQDALNSTEAFWCDWLAQSPNHGQWSAATARSLITLKALTYAPTGGIVAAPTTSLPETLGGIRNWDYRFCWLRDATLTLMSLMNSGFYAEAKAWRDWLIRAVAGHPADIQIMYGVAGERRLTELTLDWLPGYENSKPVRIGNAAAGQIQLDVYGEVIDCFYQGLKGGLELSETGWSLITALLEELEKRWDQPDRGLWESRGEPRHYTHSKMMCWVAFDRALKLVKAYNLKGPVERWRKLRDAIHDQICERGFDAKLNSFVAWYGSDLLDSSLLLMPTTGFLPLDDVRIHGTIAAIESRMMADGFVLRHDPKLTETGLKHGEGAFIACSFWLADAYALLGRCDDANKLVERLLALCNDVGLLAEEYGVPERRQLGNFPQAFSHVALINSVHNLTTSRRPAEQRSENGAGASRPMAELSVSAKL